MQITNTIFLMIFEEKNLKKVHNYFFLMLDHFQVISFICFSYIIILTVSGWHYFSEFPPWDSPSLCRETVTTASDFAKRVKVIFPIFLCHETVTTASNFRKREMSHESQTSPHQKLSINLQINFHSCPNSSQILSNFLTQKYLEGPGFKPSTLSIGTRGWLTL